MAGGFVEGGITGRASWASKELTTPRLGARWFVIRLGTGRVIDDGVDEGAVVDPVFCKSVEVEDTLLSSVASIGSLLTVFEASKLSRLLTA